MSRWEEMKPAVGKQVLVMLAGLIWVGAGCMLNWLAARWLGLYKGHYVILFVLAGIIIAIIKTHFVFSRIVRNNLARIGSMTGKGFILAFISWKSYLLIAVMMSLGISLRHSTFPKEYLAVLYIGIGLALVLSGTKYFAALVRVSAEN